MDMARAGLFLAAAALAAAPAAGRAARVDEAKGRFEIQMHPASAAGAPVVRMTMDKRWSGDLAGESSGEFLSVGSPASGDAGYVAMERFTGALKGREGGFAVQQSGTMEGGRAAMTATVVPGSGTGALTGLAGSLTIDPAAGHAYVLRYTLPGG